MKRPGRAALVGAVAIFALSYQSAAGDEGADLPLDAAEAISTSAIDARSAALLLGSVLGAPSGEASLGRQFLYVEAKLAFASYDPAMPFPAYFGAFPKANVASAGTLNSRFADVAAALRDSHLRAWRDSNSDVAARSREALLASSYFAHIAVRVLESRTRVDASRLADAVVVLGSIQQRLGGRPETLSSAGALYARQREVQSAMSRADAAFSSSSSAKGEGAASPIGYFEESAAQLFAPVELAAAGARGTFAALAQKDTRAARAALAALASAINEIEAVERFLAAKWPCSPALVEGRLWRGRRAALLAHHAELTDVGPEERAKFLAEADHEFRAALAIASHASGGADEDFKSAAASYLSFLRESGENGNAREQALAAATKTPPGLKTPTAWRDAMACGD